ncbi:MAG: hypothetical protein RIC14_05475 [Filomicrobium sp.]
MSTVLEKWLGRITDWSGSLGTADVSGFVDWLVEHGDEGEHVGISRRRLIGLYGEYCEFSELKPLSKGRFNRQLAKAGLVSSRPNSLRVQKAGEKEKRPTVYHVDPLRLFKKDMAENVVQLAA